MERVFVFLFSVCMMAGLAVMTTGCDKLKKSIPAKASETKSEPSTTEERAASVETEKEPAKAAPENTAR